MMSRKILEPIRIKSMEIKNRIGMAPMLAMPTDKSEFDEKTIRWFEARAKGEVGFIMTGSVNPSPAHVEGIRALAEMYPGLTAGQFYDDKYIPIFTKLADVVHKYDCKIGLQIVIASVQIGPSDGPQLYDDMFKVLYNWDIPMRGITLEEMEEYKADMAKAAARAKACGIDCVELHSGHGITLHGNFLSPFTNRRTDRYGVDWEGRCRFTCETIEAMREAVGDDYPILVRFSADELLGDLGITLDASRKYIVPALEKTSVDCLDVTQGSMLHNPEGICIPVYYPRGCFIHIQDAVKKVTKLPVIAAGRMNDMEMVERFLEQGKADIIYLGRQLIADPETPKKYFEGRSEDIRKCICDLPGDVDCGRPCTVNYEASKEGTVPIIKAEKPKKVLIIGGGIGGMETARIAVLRGHEVTLMERESVLGGATYLLSLSRLTSEYGNIVDYLSTQMRKLGVDVRVCKEATAGDVINFGADAVVVATGATMTMPEVATRKPWVMTHLEALKNKERIGNRVVIWGLTAAELAISLAQEGKDVTLIGRGPEARLAKYASPLNKFWVLKRLANPDVAETRPMINPKVMYELNVKDITPEGVHVMDKNGQVKVLPSDTVVLSLHRERNVSLFEALEGKVKELHQVGDCLEIDDFAGAIKSANEVARKL
jgi:2,4-dienoyl-CoA reductase (NADPH2)